MKGLEEDRERHTRI